MKEKKYNFKNVNDFLKIFEEINFLNEDNKKLFINKTFYIKKVIDIYYPKTNHIDQLKSKIDGMPKTNFNFEKIVFNEYLEKALKLLEESNIKYKDLLNEFLDLKSKSDMGKYMNFNYNNNKELIKIEKNINDKELNNLNNNNNFEENDEKKFYSKTKSRIINGFLDNSRIFDHKKIKFSELKINESKDKDSNFNNDNNNINFTGFKNFNNPFFSGSSKKRPIIDENINPNNNN